MCILPSSYSIITSSSTLCLWTWCGIGYWGPGYGILLPIDHALIAALPACFVWNNNRLITGLVKLVLRIGGPTMDLVVDGNPTWSIAAGYRAVLGREAQRFLAFAIRQLYLISLLHMLVCCHYLLSHFLTMLLALHLLAEWMYARYLQISNFLNSKF